MMKERGEGRNLHS